MNYFKLIAFVSIVVIIILWIMSHKNNEYFTNLVAPNKKGRLGWGGGELDIGTENNNFKFGINKNKYMGIFKSGYIADAIQREGLTDARV
jgi:hypothetical protein